jgi:hypothetical protein
MTMVTQEIKTEKRQEAEILTCVQTMSNAQKGHIRNRLDDLLDVLVRVQIDRARS